LCGWSAVHKTFCLIKLCFAAEDEVAEMVDVVEEEVVVMVEEVVEEMVVVVEEEAVVEEMVVVVEEEVVVVEEMVAAEGMCHQIPLLYLLISPQAWWHERWCEGCYRSPQT
jgi:hypothetical protein